MWRTYLLVEGKNMDTLEHQKEVSRRQTAPAPSPATTTAAGQGQPGYQAFIDALAKRRGHGYWYSSGAAATGAGNQVAD